MFKLKGLLLLLLLFTSFIVNAGISSVSKSGLTVTVKCDDANAFCSWNFGDGPQGASGSTAYHTYSKSGTYIITLQVTSNNSFYSTTTSVVMSGSSTILEDMGYIITSQYGNWGGAGSRIKVMDYNSDGKEDIVLGPDGAGKWYGLLNNNGSFLNNGAIITGAYGNWGNAGNRIKVMDYNADGRDDIVLGPDGGGKWYGLLNNGGSFTNQGALISNAYANWGSAGDRIRVMDYNADGKDDIVLGPDSNGRWYALRNNGSTLVNAGTIIYSPYGNWDGAGSRIKVMDYNSDGKEDIVLGPDGAGKWYGLLNNNGSFLNNGAIITGAYGNWGNAGNRIKVMDYNADGRDDIVLGPDGGGKWYGLLNNGGSFTNKGALISNAYANWGKAGDRIRVIDYDADGRDDIVLGPDGSGKWFVISQK